MPANSKTVALIGSETLLAREVRDIVATGGADFGLRLVAAVEEETGALTRVGDEASLVTGLNAESLADTRAVILAGNAESSRQTLELLGEEPDAAVIDLTYTAEERPDARLRAPLVETEPVKEAAVHVIAHPAAIAIALLLRRLHSGDPVRNSVILLSFKSLPKAVFDAQLSFNLLARYGEEAPAPLEETEMRIERHLASLLALPGDGEGVPMPSLRLIQAPVFHGYSFSAWVEFRDAPDMEMLESGLATDGIEVRGGDFEPPSNVGQAGQGGIAVGGITPDRNHADAVWLWFVADNVRLAAENAVAVARQLV